MEININTEKLTAKIDNIVYDIKFQELFGCQKNCDFFEKCHTACPVKNVHHPDWFKAELFPYLKLKK